MIGGRDVEVFAVW